MAVYTGKKFKLLDTGKELKTVLTLLDTGMLLARSLLQGISLMACQSLGVNGYVLFHTVDPMFIAVVNAYNSCIKYALC